MDRIAVVIGKMHSGGKKNLVMEYYRNMNRDEIQFDFICDSDSNSIPKEEIEALGGRVYVIPKYQKIFANIRAMKKIFKENNYPILHGYNGTMNLFAMYAGWAEKIPIRINESISMAHKADKKTILKNMLKPFSRAFATHFAANGIECGKWQFGKELFDSGKVEIFKTVIDVDASAYDKELRKKTREEFGIPEDAYVFGHIGRLTEQKNTLFLIDIFNEIQKLNPSSRLIIIGDGNLKEEMLAKIEEYGISDNVLYLGRREDIKAFYNAFDCFLLPSLYEGLPLVGVEAQNAGIPVMFSSEIPKESSACEDLGHFVSLEETAKIWALKSFFVAKKNRSNRRGRTEEITRAGFNSKEEAKKLFRYYKRLLRNLDGKES